MRFLMVDRICELESGKRSRGIKNVSWDGDFLEEAFPRLPVFSPVIGLEAAAQLVSWILVERTQFKFKPVITVADFIGFSAHAVPGDRIVLEGEVESFSEESALAHAALRVNGRPAAELKHAVCYLYPLEELESPDRVRLHFKNLYKEGSLPPPPAPGPGNRGFGKDLDITPRVWVDRVLDSDDPEKLAGVKNITATEAYFNDHFPNKPVLPGVMTAQCMVSLCRMLAARALERSGCTLKRPILTALKKVKFRRFVLPGDQLFLEATLSEFSPQHSRLNAAALIGGKKAATATAEFEHLEREAYLTKYIQGKAAAHGSK